jgi:hypothetical protein
LSLGTHTLKAVAKDNQGATGESAVVTIAKINLAVGMNYEGGIIAYIDASGEHGLIAAPTDQSTGIKWMNDSYIDTGATATAIGTGKSNTETIVAAQGDGEYAAKLCLDLVLNDYDDWFLPSLDELNELYINREIIGGFDLSDNPHYWSSSEVDYNRAWEINFRYYGYQSDNFKHANFLRVRAVRYF